MLKVWSLLLAAVCTTVLLDSSYSFRLISVMICVKEGRI